jgi:hypothetical protein
LPGNAVTYDELNCFLKLSGFFIEGIFWWVLGGGSLSFHHEMLESKFNVSRLLESELTKIFIFIGFFIGLILQA